MKFIVKNLSVRKTLGLPIGAAKAYTADEMADIADVVARQMSPVMQALVDSKQTIGGQEQAISVPKMQPSPQKVRCYVDADDNGTEQEMTAKDLLVMFAEKIQERAAARIAAHKARISKRAEQGMR